MNRSASQQKGPADAMKLRTSRWGNNPGLFGVAQNGTAGSLQNQRRPKKQRSETWGHKPNNVAPLEAVKDQETDPRLQTPEGRALLAHPGLLGTIK